MLSEDEDDEAEHEASLGRRIYCKVFAVAAVILCGGMDDELADTVLLGGHIYLLADMVTFEMCSEYEADELEQGASFARRAVAKEKALDDWLSSSEKEDELEH